MSILSIALVAACVASVAIGVPLEIAALISAAAAIFAIMPFEEAYSFLGYRVVHSADDYVMAAVAMLALAGELHRVMGAEIAVRRLLQTVMAGRRATPLFVPVVGQLLQGALLMRLGLSLDAEAKSEAREMLPSMERQKVALPLAWTCISAGAGSALLMPPCFAAVLMGLLYGVSIANQMLVLLPVGVVLALLLIVQVHLAARSCAPLQPVPPLSKHRLFQFWRDQQGVTWLLLTPLSVLVALASGISTPTESLGFIGAAAFAAAWAQPVRPRIKDVVAALLRASTVTGRFMLLVLAGSILAAALNIGQAPIDAGRLTGWPGIAVAGIFALMAPALLGWIAGVPGAMVLSVCLIGPAVGELANLSVFAVQVGLAAAIGATARLVLRAPLGLETEPWGRRGRHALFATGPLLAAWGLLSAWPRLVLALPEWLLV